MPDKIPQSDCKGDVAVGRDTGFPKHGAMLRIGARGKRGAARWGVGKINRVQFGHCSPAFRTRGAGYPPPPLAASGQTTSLQLDVV
jgi:hypothetical protein